MWNHFCRNTLKSGWSDDESFPIWLKFGFMVPFESWFICAAMIFFAVFLSWGEIRRLVAASLAASSGDLSSNTLRAEFPTRLNERLLDFWIRLGSTWAMGGTRCWRLRTEDGDCETGLRSRSSLECCRSWRWERWTTPATGDSLAVRGWCFGASGFGVSVRPRIWCAPYKIINLAGGRYNIFEYFIWILFESIRVSFPLDQSESLGELGYFEWPLFEFENQKTHLWGILNF